MCAANTIREHRTYSNELTFLIGDWCPVIPVSRTSHRLATWAILVDSAQSPPLGLALNLSGVVSPVDRTIFFVYEQISRFLHQRRKVSRGSIFFPREDPFLVSFVVAQRRMRAPG